jgi:hypothetical protein
VVAEGSFNYAAIPQEICEQHLPFEDYCASGAENAFKGDAKKKTWKNTIKGNSGGKDNYKCYLAASINPLPAVLN